MVRNALPADDVWWLKRYEYKFSLHVFPKDIIIHVDYTMLGFKLSERISLPKNPRLCLEHFDADCFEYRVRFQNDLLGS